MKCFEQLLWKDIKNSVKNLNHDLFKIIDDISPEFPIYRAKYTYGEVISDHKHFYFPKSANKEPLLSKDSPFCFILDKKLESYLQYKNKVIPHSIYSAGTLIPQNYEIVKYNQIKMRPSDVFYLSSGVRSINILPLHNENEYYDNLAMDFNIDRKLSPRNIVDHHKIITTINDRIKPDWHSDILLFDEKWKHAIFNNKKWEKLKIYILEQSIKVNSSRRNGLYLDHAITDITNDLKVKKKDFSEEMMKYILLTSIGEQIGLKPAVDELGLPVEALTDAFNGSYKPTTTPVIIEPCEYTPSNANYPIYLSIGATTYNLNSQKTLRPLAYLAEISKRLNIFLEEFENHPFTKNTVFAKIKDHMSIKFYSVLGNSDDILESTKLIDDDDRFKILYNRYKGITQYGFAQKSIFTKALISIKNDLIGDNEK